MTSSGPAGIAAALAGRYTIERELGAGGMATVYLAIDLKHHRRVAVKVLRGEIAAALGVERFEREIKVAAQLQHPHILPLLDSGEAGGLYYYVMPYVEGESLRDRLARHGELPIPDAVRILIEVTDALAHAHEHGVVHRDIKPDNILVSGRHALVMDFGVAKAVSDATGAHTLTSIGVALGTPTYMAPEQAAADPHVDHRVDLYAVGVLGYELLTGEPPFVGGTVQETLAAHMTQEPPPLSSRREGVSRVLERVLRKCLAKRAADRWQSAGELLAQLEPLATPSGESTPTTTRPAGGPFESSRWLRPVLIAGGILLAVALGAIALRPGGTNVALGKVSQLTFEPGLEIEPAISPDGKFVAYAAGPISATRVFVRQLGGRAVPLDDESGPPQRRPIWSPDGAHVVFERGADLYVVPALGGAPRLVATKACCAAWSRDGQRIAFVRAPLPGLVPRPQVESLFFTSAEGENSTLIGVAYDPYSLAWSPDGRWLAMTVGNSGATRGQTLFGNIGPSRITLLPTPSGAGSGTLVTVSDSISANESPAWLPDSRHLLFISNRDGPRDIYVATIGSDGRASGEPRRVTSGLDVNAVSVSSDGRRLAYAVYTSRSNVWSIAIPQHGAGPVSVDRAVQVTSGNQTIEGMATSPDDQWLYFDSNRSGNQDLYRMPLARSGTAAGDPEQLTTDAADEFYPRLSPDGRWIAFHGTQYGTRDIYVMPAAGGAAERVTSDPGQERAPMWSPDGQSLAYYQTGSTADGIWIVSRAPTPHGGWGSPRRVFDYPAFARWSPDGRWLVIARDHALWLVSTTGGAARLVYQLRDTLSEAEPVRPIWSADGKSIYYKAIDRTGRASFWSVPASGGVPRLLVRFDDPLRPSYRPEFDSDGKRLYFTINDRQSDVYVAELTGIK